jgi:hypothetical protein
MYKKNLRSYLTPLGYPEKQIQKFYYPRHKRSRKSWYLKYRGKNQRLLFELGFISSIHEQIAVNVNAHKEVHLLSALSPNRGIITRSLIYSLLSAFLSHISTLSRLHWPALASLLPLCSITNVSYNKGLSNRL